MQAGSRPWSGFWKPLSIRVAAQVQSYKSRVLFKGACGAIPEDALLLEIGPHAIMRSPLRQNCAGLPYVSTMKKGEDGTLTLREAVAGLWRKGAALTWDVPEDVPGLPPSHLLCYSLLAPSPAPHDSPCASHASTNTKHTDGVLTQRGALAKAHCSRVGSL